MPGSLSGWGATAPLAALLAIGLGTAASMAAAPTEERPYATLQGLDKITARVSEFEVEVGSIASFGTLSLTLRACRETRPEETPETAAFLEISDQPPGSDDQTVIFTGWMFASSPALSALEHAIYDVWVVGCSDGPGAAPEVSAETVADGEQPTQQRVPLSEAGIIPPQLPPSRAGR